jgi:hypothetical protein
MPYFRVTTFLRALVAIFFGRYYLTRSSALAFPKIMLLRVRSNVGTWKFSMEPSHRISDLVQRIAVRNDDQAAAATISEPCKQWELTQPLSRDPTHKEPLAMNESLQALGLTHGSMVYCRVEPKSTDGSSSFSESASASNDIDIDNRKQAAAVPSKSNDPPVIDLLDSSDDDDDDTPVIEAKPAASKSQKRQRPSSAVSSSQTSSSLFSENKKKSRPTTAAAARSGRSTPDHPSSVQIVSYNVWFGPPDASANQVHPQQRMAAIAKELQTCQAKNNDGLLFIGFQELTESLRQYLEPHLKSMGFRFCTQPLGGNYGVGLAISKQVEIVESKFLPFADTIQGRGLLYVETPTMIFGTTHLESFINAKEYDGAAPRELQIVQAATFVQDRLRQNPNLKLAMIAGDFNWDDERVRKGTSPNTPLLDLLGGEWKDPAKRFDYTYDGKENPMLSNNLRRRFDRCIYLTNPPTTNTATTNTRLDKLGLSAIPQLTWNKKNPFNGTTKVVPVAPSDHFGIAVTFESK